MQGVRRDAQLIGELFFTAIEIEAATVLGFLEAIGHAGREVHQEVGTRLGPTLFAVQHALSSQN